MKQLRILHISDTHFGASHRCSPEEPTHPVAGYPSLFDLLEKDLQSDVFKHSAWQPGKDKSPSPLLVMVTGDLTQGAAPEEFKAAHNFLKKFDNVTLLGSKVSLRDLFLVPGNHDVVYDTADGEVRMTPYTNFYSKLYAGTRGAVLPHEAARLVQVHKDRERGFIVAEINSTAYVQKGTDEAQRGNVDMGMIGKLDNELKAIPSDEREQLIRIAILHHHPILVPDLVEPQRGYDAVVNSKHLLKLLREYGFHLVLHGHKHYPHVFSYDSDSLWQESVSPSTLVMAGGSAGSRELPPGGRRCNSYNLICVKWHPEASQARVRFVTRGLTTEDGSGEMVPNRWEWKTLRDGDRRLYSPRDLPNPVRLLKAELNGSSEAKRRAVYGETRLNMAVCEVLPSLIPGQAYEVRLWVVPHVDDKGVPKPGWEPPSRVVWSAGPLFPTKECQRSDDPQFCCTFNYWGPMVVQAEMFFADGSSGCAHLYARMPGLGAPKK